MRKGVKSFIVCLFVICSRNVFSIATNELGGRVFLTSESAPKMIQQEAGKDVRLKCGLKDSPIDPGPEMQADWYFKPCGDDENQYTCENAMDLEWKPLSCDASQCKPIFYIRNVSEEHSGLYKCTLRPFETNDFKKLQIHYVRVYQLKVKSINLPEFVDDLPSNTTVEVGSRIVLHCRVQSKAHLATKWFRRLDTPLNDFQDQSGIVMYSNKSYKLISSAGERIVGGETYLSKLILDDVTEDDSGIYACVALNYRGHRIKEIYVNVEPADIDSQSRTDPSEFLLLFLMPLGLALVPISLWFCIIFGKRFSTYKEEHNERIERKKNVNSNYIRVNCE